MSNLAVPSEFMRRKDRPSFSVRYFSRHSYPGYIILTGIAVMCCFWAGVKPVGFAIAHVTALLALAASLWFSPVCLKNPFQNRMVVFFSITLAVFLLNIIVKPTPASGIDMLLMTIDIMIVFFVMARTPQKYLKSLFVGFCVLGVLAAAMHIILVITMQDQYGIPGPLKHANHFGVFALLVVFPAVGGFFATHRGGIRLWGITAAILSFVFLLIDVKTGSVALAVIGVFLYILRSHRQTGRSFLLVIILLLAALGLASYHLSTWIFQDVFRSMAIENPLEYHQFPMRAAFRAGMSHFFMGLGAGNFSYLSGVFKDPGIYSHLYRAHNVFLELFAELGVLGLFSVLAALWVVFQKTFLLSEKRSVSRWIHRGFKVSLLLMIPAALWDFGPQIPANLFLIAFSFGFLMADRPSELTPPPPGKLDPVLPWIPVGFILILIPSLIAGCNYEIGLRDEKIGLWRTAEKHYERAIFFAPFDDRFSAAAGLLSVRLKAATGEKTDYEKAQRFLEKSLHRNPNQPSLCYASAFLLKETGKSQNGQWGQALKRAIDLDPFNHRFSTAYAQYLVEIGDINGSVEEMDRIIPSLTDSDYSTFSNDLVRLWPDPDILSNFLSSHRNQLDPVLFLEIIKTIRNVGLDIIAKPLAVEISKELDAQIPADLLHKYARILFSLDEGTSAIDLIERVRDSVLTPEILAKMLVAGGDFFQRKKGFEKALVWYSDAHSADPKAVGIVLRLISLNKKMDSLYPAMKTLEDLVESNPDSYQAHFALAREYQQQGMSLRALQEFRTANSLSGNKYSEYSMKLADELEIPELWRYDYSNKNAGNIEN